MTLEHKQVDLQLETPKEALALLGVSDSNIKVLEEELKVASVYEIVDQLNSCGVCPSYAVRKATKGDTSPGSCCPVAIGRALIDMYNEINKDKQTVAKKDNTSPKCPKCGEALIQEGGCIICKNCGWSKCD